MTSSPPAAKAAPEAIAVACPAADLALLRIAGADAEAFLQGQLSSDVKALGIGALQRSSYNSPKGRMLASLVLWREAADAFRALLAADLAPAIAKRLRMYVLRAKVTLEELPPGLAGLAGTGALAAANEAFGVNLAPAQGALAGEACVLALPDGRVAIALAPGTAADAVARLGRVPGVAVGDLDAWRLARIQAGVPLVGAATSDLFVPQALNFDALGGISFRKGCYPGQEIVARTHYLGRLKERMYALRGPAPAPAAGTRIHAPLFGEQACGTVVDAAPHPDGGSALLAVVQRAAVDAGELHLDGPAGPPLVLATLPYPVPEPAAPPGRLA